MLKRKLLLINKYIIKYIRLLNTRLPEVNQCSYKDIINLWIIVHKIILLNTKNSDSGKSGFNCPIIVKQNLK